MCPPTPYPLKTSLDLCTQGCHIFHSKQQISLKGNEFVAMFIGFSNGLFPTLGLWLKILPGLFLTASWSLAVPRRAGLGLNLRPVQTFRKKTFPVVQERSTWCLPLAYHTDNVHKYITLNFPNGTYSFKT